MSATPTRRAVLAGAGAAAALPAVAAPTGTQVSPDADLLRLLGEMDALQRQADPIFDRAWALPIADAKGKELLAAAYALMDQWHHRKRQVAALPARTAAGLRAKAEMAMTFIPLRADETPCEDDMITWSVLRDVLARGPA